MNIKDRLEAGQKIYERNLAERQAALKARVTPWDAKTTPVTVFHGATGRTDVELPEMAISDQGRSEDQRAFSALVAGVCFGLLGLLGLVLLAWGAWERWCQ